nr:ATPase, T2SS/T4P/T4SS family [Angustibacter aerolatus]
MPGRARFRVNVYRQREALGAAFRLIPYEIKGLEDLGVPPSVSNFAGLPRGMVLVTGPTGSGKSTTLAGIIDLANRTRHEHIMTVEDPIEFLHRHKGCLVNQREVGEDTKSFSNALKHALRQDPDIILVGEMRDLETIGVALTAAETGHLVFATLHTQDAAQTIDRVIDVFPSEQQQQVRVQARRRHPGRRLPDAVQDPGRPRPRRRDRGDGGDPRHPQPHPRGQDPPDLQARCRPARSTACTPSTSTWPSSCAPTRSRTSTAWRSATTSRTSTACSAGSRERAMSTLTFEYAVRDRAGKARQGHARGREPGPGRAEAQDHGLRPGQHHQDELRHEQGDHPPHPGEPGEAQGPGGHGPPVRDDDQLRSVAAARADDPRRPDGEQAAARGPGLDPGGRRGRHLAVVGHGQAPEDLPAAHDQHVPGRRGRRLPRHRAAADRRQLRGRGQPARQDQVGHDLPDRGVLHRDRGRHRHAAVHRADLRQDVHRPRRRAAGTHQGAGAAEPRWRRSVRRSASWP